MSGDFLKAQEFLQSAASNPHGWVLLSSDMAHSINAAFAEMNGAVDKVVHAIDNEGVRPMHHRRIMKEHRAQWPTLWNALDSLRGVRNA